MDRVDIGANLQEKGSKDHYDSVSQVSGQLSTQKTNDNVGNNFKSLSQEKNIETYDWSTSRNNI